MDTDPFLIRQKLLRSISPIQLRFSSVQRQSQQQFKIDILPDPRCATLRPHLLGEKRKNHKIMLGCDNDYLTFDNLFLISIQPYLQSNLPVIGGGGLVYLCIPFELLLSLRFFFVNSDFSLFPSCRPNRKQKSKLSFRPSKNVRSKIRFPLFC